MEKKDIKKVVTTVLGDTGIGLKRVILFGSRARGDSDNGSDWNILIVVDRPISGRERRDVAHRVRLAFAKMLVPVDVIIKSHEEIEAYKNYIGTVTREALKEGVVL